MRFDATKIYRRKGYTRGDDQIFSRKPAAGHGSTASHHISTGCSPSVGVDFRMRITGRRARACPRLPIRPPQGCGERSGIRSEEHTSELQSLMRISYAVFCLNKKTTYMLLTRS